MKTENSTSAGSQMTAYQLGPALRCSQIKPPSSFKPYIELHHPQRSDLLYQHHFADTYCRGMTACFSQAFWGAGICTIRQTYMTRLGGWDSVLRKSK